MVMDLGERAINKQKNRRSVARLAFPILEVHDPAKLKMAILGPELAILVLARPQPPDHGRAQAITSRMIA
jgi:hypothetical protein